MARLLIIDDEKNVRMTMAMALEGEGHSVVLAEDGARGLEAYGRGEDFDLVLVDQRMPGMEGLDVLRELRSRNPQARMVMITAFATIDLAVDAMKSGAVNFLRKPFTTETLRGAVQSALLDLGEEPPVELAEEPIHYGVYTINGFHIESMADSGRWQGGNLSHVFEVHGPGGYSRICTVLVPLTTVEKIKEHTGRRATPGWQRFWHALCEYVLIDYVWKQAKFPEEEPLTIRELGKDLLAWIRAVQAYEEKAPSKPT